MRKIFTYSLIFAALAACKGEDKKQDSAALPAASVQEFQDKTLAILKDKFKDSPVSQWSFEGDIQITGDGKKSEFILPKRQWTIGKLDTPEYTINMSWPQNTVNAEALKDDQVLLTSQIELSQYSLSPVQFSGENLGADMTVDFSTSMAGIQENEEIYDLNTKRLLKADYKAKDIAFNYDYKIDIDEQTLADVSLLAKFEKSDAQYVSTPKADVSDFSYNGTYTNGSSEVKEIVNDLDYPLIITALSKMPKAELTMSGQNVGNAWFDKEAMSLCFNDLVAFGDEEKRLKGGNCFWSIFKNAPLGQIELTTKYAGDINYNIDYSAFKKDETYADIFNILKTDSVDIGLKGEVEVKANIEEKDDIVAFSVFEAINNIEISHKLDLENIKAQIAATGQADAQLLEAAHQMLKAFAIKDVNFALGGQVKRSSLQSIDDISNFDAWGNFNFGQSALNALLNITTAKGFVEAELFWNSDKENLIAADFSEQDILTGKVIVKIQNFDDMIATISQVVPQVQMFAALIKGLGKEDAQDASVLIFELTMNENGQPLINGMVLPFM